jgi:long-chain acyl-CoA synthetase
MFVQLSNLPNIHRYDFSSLRGIFVGAAPLTHAIKEGFEASLKVTGKTGGRMVEGYGLTEAVTAIMANPYQGMHKVGSIGLPFPTWMSKSSASMTATILRRASWARLFSEAQR